MLKFFYRQIQASLPPAKCKYQFVYLKIGAKFPLKISSSPWGRDSPKMLTLIFIVFLICISQKLKVRFLSSSCEATRFYLRTIF